MSKTIWKYELQLAQHQTVRMGHNSRILNLDQQNGKLCMWVEVEENDTQEDWRFWIMGTGIPFPEDKGGVYLGTVLMHGGTLVCHVYTDRL